MGLLGFRQHRARFSRFRLQFNNLPVRIAKINGVDKLEIDDTPSFNTLGFTFAKHCLYVRIVDPSAI